MPRLLDLFCKAGGAGEGYRRAGFDVTGVDIEPQPNNPHTFIQAEALAYLAEHGPEFDAIHASPCQGYSQLAAMHPERDYPLLIDPVRSALKTAGKPYVIENVPGAPLQTYSDLFGSCAVPCSVLALSEGSCAATGSLKHHFLYHSLPAITRAAPWASMASGHTKKHRMLYRDEAAEAMGIDWMTRDEMCQAIPPAYTEFIGRHLLQFLNALRVSVVKAA